MIKIIREFESLRVDLIDLGWIYLSVVVCHCLWWGNETHHNGNIKNDLILFYQGPTCQIIVVVGQGGFIFCPSFLHFVRNWDKESLSKCVSILCCLGLGDNIFGLFESVLFWGILKPIKGNDMFTRVNLKRFYPLDVP